MCVADHNLLVISHKVFELVPKVKWSTTIFLHQPQGFRVKLQGFRIQLQNYILRNKNLKNQFKIRSLRNIVFGNIYVTKKYSKTWRHALVSSKSELFNIKPIDKHIWVCLYYRSATTLELILSTIRPEKINK